MYPTGIGVNDGVDGGRDTGNYWYAEKYVDFAAAKAQILSEMQGISGTMAELGTDDKGKTLPAGGCYEFPAGTFGRGQDLDLLNVTAGPGYDHHPSGGNGKYPQGMVGRQAAGQHRIRPAERHRLPVPGCCHRQRNGGDGPHCSPQCPCGPGRRLFQRLRHRQEPESRQPRAICGPTVARECP